MNFSWTSNGACVQFFGNIACVYCRDVTNVFVRIVLTQSTDVCMYRRIGVLRTLMNIDNIFSYQLLQFFYLEKN